MRQIQRCEEATVQQAQGLSGILISSVVSGTVLFAAQSAFAAAQVTQVALNPSGNGASVLLTTEGKDTPQIFASTNGKRWVAEIANSQLKLASGSFQQANPADGIASVAVTALDQNRVRLTIEGKDAAPEVQVVRSGEKGLLFTLEAGIEKAKDLQPQKTSFSQRLAQAVSGSPDVRVINVPKPDSGGLPALTSQVSPLAPFGGGTPLISNPNVTVSAPANVPGVPTLPRAVAPPVGDIAVGSVNAAPELIDLGTAERVPRLVLRDAPAREVLSLLARAARLNLVFTGDAGDKNQPSQNQAQGQVVNDGPRVSLDLENEPIQNAFNYVLQVSGLQANRIGRTVFVGPRLPDNARNLITRTFRLNQVNAGTAAAFLSAQGAETQRVVESTKILVEGTGENRIRTETKETEIKPLGAKEGNGPLLLKGLSVLTDERLNAVTLVGSPRQIEVATSFLTQLDARRRQVVVNVRVIDINLANLDRFSTSFSFGVGPNRLINTGGIAILNIGRNAPAQAIPALTAPQSIGSSNIGANVAGINGPSFEFAKNFFAQLQTAVTSGNAKILTDPSLVVQEGQAAKVNLTQEVITNVKQETTFGTGTSQTTVTVEKKEVGLVLGVTLDRVDDNGFISLKVNPVISQPDSTERIQIGNSFLTVTLVSQRSLESGQVRLRDAQTLVLSGIIQDQDRTSVTKVPILGDIPILGALFRRTERSNQRREVIVLVTPRVLDDSERSTFGYGYTPGSGIQKVLDEANK